MSCLRNGPRPRDRFGRLMPTLDLQAMTAERLRQAHGVQRAWAIAAGLDPTTAADLAAWRALGSRRAAA